MTFGKKHLIIADYFSKFPYIYPVASSDITSRTINHLHENSSPQKASLPLWCPTMALHLMEMTSRDLPQNLTSCTYHFISLIFHQSNGFIEAMVKKVKNAPTEKTDGSPNAQAKALLQLCDTPISTYLPFTSRNSTWKTGTRHSPYKTSKTESIMRWIPQRLIEIQNSQKEQLDRSHRAKDLPVLKVNEKVRFFPNKQGTGAQTTWFTGTVSQNTGLWSVHTWSKAQAAESIEETEHTWSPFATMAAHSRGHTTAKEDEAARKTLLSKPQAKTEKAKTMSFKTDTAWRKGQSHNLSMNQSMTHHILHLHSSLP